MRYSAMLLCAALFANLLLPAARADTPFSSFLGEWTLKDDKFQQVWDGETVETLSIPDHYTLCETLNTDGSVLCSVTAGDLRGHILWSIDVLSETVHHQSHFGVQRLGSGTGTLNGTQDLTLKVSFKDEPDGTYRIYEYVWLDADSYSMMSRQYDADGLATGNWYGGVFVRLVDAD